MASRAKEDYLKTIYELEAKVGIAKTTHLADKLGVRAATVTEMIQKLSKEPDRTITYKHHQGVQRALPHHGVQPPLAQSAQAASADLLEYSPELLLLRVA